VRRSVSLPLTAVALGVLLAFAGCGSVTGKHTDGGGTGGSHGDSSTKMDVAADHQVQDAKTQDARHDALESHDARGGKDMSVTDARPTDARGRDAVANGGSGGGGGMSGGGGSGAGGAGGECQSNGDCMLYPKLGSGCCGVCQPKSDPDPPPIQCLIACLNPLVSCGCVNHQCVGSTKQL
jgi:hypothetical protein